MLRWFVLRSLRWRLAFRAAVNCPPNGRYGTNAVLVRVPVFDPLTGGAQAPVYYRTDLSTTTKNFKRKITSPKEVFCRNDIICLGIGRFSDIIFSNNRPIHP